MNIETIFPFYKDSKIIKSYNTEDFDLYDKKFVFEPEDNDYLIDVAKKRYGDNQTLVKVYRLMPNDVYLLAPNIDPILRIYLCNEDRPSKVYAQITELDYGRLARESLRLEYIEGQNVVTKKLLNSYDMREVSDPSFFEDSLINESSDVERLTKARDMLVEEARIVRENVKTLNEAFPTGSSDPVSAYMDEDDGWNNEPYVDVLKHYMERLVPTEKIPLLVGISGIAKSATIKSLVREYDQKKAGPGEGYRLTDLRVSFLSRLDIEGLKDVVDLGAGESIADAAPTMEFLTCTDEYLEFARGMKVTLSEKLESLREEFWARSEQVPEEPEDEEDIYGAKAYQVEMQSLEDLGHQIESIEKIHAKFAEASKTPVLVLDEITRSDKAIRGALTTIINQRLYGSRSLRECRIIAATNAPVGYDELKDKDGRVTHVGNEMRLRYFSDHFIGTELNDVAVLDRFDKILMTPEMVFPEWLEWANGPGDMHKLVMDFIKGDLDKAYNFGPIDEGAPEGERDLPIVHATFRAWTMISDYIKKREDKDSDDPKYQTYVVPMLEGLLGKEMAGNFASHLNKNGWKEFVPEEGEDDPLNNLIEDCLDHDVPLSLVGASGIGKTARVMRYAKKQRGYEVELLPLSTKTRIDIMGLPSLTNIEDYIVGEDDPHNLLKEDPDFKHAVDKNLEESGIQRKITTRSPESDLFRKIKKCIETNTPLVLFFDEFNRTIDPVAQTAVFEAISDGRFAGIKFPKGLIKVVLAGNPPDEKTGEAGHIDTALVARTVHYRQLKYTKQDVESFFKFAKKDAWKQLEDFDDTADDWVMPMKEKDGYEKGAIVNHNKATWESLTHQNLVAPGEWESGMSKILIEYLEQDHDRALELIMSVEKAALNKNTTSTRSLKMLSDLVDNFSIDDTFNGSLLLPRSSDRTDWSDFASGQDDVMLDILTKIKKRINNWSALKSGVPYKARDGKEFDLEEMVEAWKIEFDNYKQDQYSMGSPERNELYNVTNNFLEIDQKIKKRRQSLVEKKVDPEFGKEFLEYYNVISGTVTNITIADVVNEELIDDYFDQTVGERGGIGNVSNNWIELVMEVYDYHGTGSGVDYAKVIQYFGKSINRDEFQDGLETLISDQQEGVHIIKEIEFGLIKELENNDFDIQPILDHDIYELAMAVGVNTSDISEFVKQLKEDSTEDEEGEGFGGLHGLGS